MVHHSTSVIDVVVSFPKLTIVEWFDKVWCRAQNLVRENFFCSTRNYNKDFLESEFFFKVPSAVADRLVSREFEPGCDFPIRLFNRTTNPNIILITMEGINAQLLKTYNRSYSEMPFLDSIMNSSYTFSKCFSVGFRTEQGLAAILSGSLSTPYVNLTDNINNLPC